MIGGESGNVRQNVPPRVQITDGPPPPRHVAEPVPYTSSPKEQIRAFMKKHGKKLWWLHSVYALGLGISVIVFAKKGFDHARWLAVSIGAAWLLVILFFRINGSGKSQKRDSVPTTTKQKVGFFAMTYALKNLYQGMLFFLLPFYWKATTFWTANSWFVVVLGICAFLSTMDVVFDRVVFKTRALASIFHAVALFGCLNLVVPALFPDTRTLTSLLVAVAISVLGFWTIHFSLTMLKDRRWLLAIAASLGLSLTGVYYARTAIPPVPMYVSKGAVGPMVLKDGRLAMEVRELHPSVIDKLIAITDVVVPGGKGDSLLHVWRHNGHEVHRATETTSKVDGPEGAVRLRSGLTGRDLPQRLVGDWSVDVETQDGQLVGRTRFLVVE